MTDINGSNPRHPWICVLFAMLRLVDEDFPTQVVQMHEVYTETPGANGVGDIYLIFEQLGKENLNTDHQGSKEYSGWLLLVWLLVYCNYKRLLLCFWFVIKTKAGAFFGIHNSPGMHLMIC